MSREVFFRPGDHENIDRDMFQLNSTEQFEEWARFTGSHPANQTLGGDGLTVSVSMIAYHFGASAGEEIQIKHTGPSGWVLRALAINKRAI